MISDRQYGVVSIGQGQLCDEINSYHLEGEVATASDWEEGWSGWMSVDFIHLASGASFDIGSNEVFHVWPPVMGLYEFDGFCDSRVASSF